MSYLCTDCEETVIPTDEPEDGWESMAHAVELTCTQCWSGTVHIPGPKGYVKRE